MGFFSIQFLKATFVKFFCKNKTSNDNFLEKKLVANK